jgi:hypothetical protein
VADIKSAWEIAQEKASKLGELSAEEREGQRQDRCRLIGESLTEKYLSHHDISSLEEELRKHSPQDKYLISQAAVHRLIQALDLQYLTELTEISQGILNLAHSDATTKTLDEIKALVQEYVETEDKESQEIERAGREMLHQLRISGTAVGRLNMRAKAEWQKKLDQTARPFDERLNYLKQELYKYEAAS